MLYLEFSRVLKLFTLISMYRSSDLGEVWKLQRGGVRAPWVSILIAGGGDALVRSSFWTAPSASLPGMMGVWFGSLWGGSFGKWKLK